jgi:hyaluronan synthase
MRTAAVHKFAAWVAVVMTAALILAFHADQWAGRWNFAVVFYVAVAAMLVWMLTASARRRAFTHLPVASGKVVVIVPAYDEDPDTLYACVRSLVLQTVPPDEIVVVDDGSDVPVVPIDLPTVTWLRQDNAGKRRAQVAGLGGCEWADFIVTVDSDSVVAPDGLEHLLRPMSDPRIQAATGTCLVRNRAASLLTRVVDLEINLGNMVMRRARSSVGAVTPTSGPLAVYRAAIVWDNLLDYLEEGTFGDDRRLTHYALMRGQVVAVDEATVECDMPTAYVGTFKQRTRWFKGYMRYAGWELRNFTGWPLFLRCWSLMLVALYPLIIGFVFVAVPLTGGRFYWEALAYWAALLYVQTSLYLERPGMSRSARLASWLLLTPLLVPYQALLIRPAMYYAATQTRRMGWATRGATQRGRHRGARVPILAERRAIR